MRQRSYRFGLYGRLGDPASTAALAHDLDLFVKESPDIDGDFAAMIASFEAPASGDAATFERLLWSTLQQLHDIDAQHHGWAPGVSADPTAPGFSFSFTGTPFFGDSGIRRPPVLGLAGACLSNGTQKSR